MFSALPDTLDGLDVDLQALDDVALVNHLREIEHLARRVAASIAATVGTIDRRRVWRCDGHASVRGLLRAELRWSGQHVTEVVRAAALVHRHPEVDESLRAGAVGEDQVSELARANAHPRCGDRLGEFLHTLLDHAKTISFNEFKMCVERWRQLGDQDGADQGR